MIETALNRVGAGRSLVATKDGTIIAGNATLEAAASAGIEEAIIVPTYGDRLIIHQRMDLETGDARSVELAIYDNRAGELATWDPDVLAELEADNVSFQNAWTATEWGDITGTNAPGAGADPTDVSPQLGDLQYRVVVECTDEHDQANLIASLEGMGRTVKALIS